MGHAGIRRIAKIVMGALLAVPALVAVAAAIAGQPAEIRITAPASVKVGDRFTVAGVVVPGDGITEVTVTATGLDGRSSSSAFVVDGAAPAPFEVEFHASGLSGGALTIVATAAAAGGPTATDRAQVAVTRGRSGR